MRFLAVREPPTFPRVAGVGGIRTLGSREAAFRAGLDRNGVAIGTPYSLQNGLDWTGVQVTLWQLSRE
jgi:hypothetical protein